MMSRRLLLVALALASVQAKQEDFIKTVFGMKAGEQNQADAELIREQIRVLRAQEQAQADAKRLAEVEAAAEPLPIEPRAEPKGTGLALKLPLVALLAGGGVRLVQHELVARALRREQLAWTEVRRACGDVGRAPAAVAARATALSEANARLESLRRRRALLSEHVLPAYQRLEVKPPRSLVNSSEAELTELNATLAERAEAAAAVLQGYASLAMQPPPHFREWPLEELEARADNITAKAPLLRKVLRLQALLGQSRADWELPAYAPSALEALLPRLELELQTLTEWRRKEALLGKVEAALWKRGEEVPVALPSLSYEELEEYYNNLQ